MKNIIALFIVVLGVVTPVAFANEHKCDCKAHDLTDECKKQCEHHK